MPKHSSSIRYRLRIITGLVLAFVGFLGIASGIVAVLDPVGSKLADDADPLGPPVTITQALMVIVTWALVLCIGIWLISKKSETQQD
jgi:hypothetical protein